MKLPSVTKKFWIVAISVAMVASFLAFYLLIYVKDRESHIVGKNYRALERLGKNILELRNSYEVSISRFNAGLTSLPELSQQKAFLYHVISYEENDFKAQGIQLRSGSEKSLAVDTVELTSADTVNRFHFHISIGDLLARSNIASTPFKDFFLIRIFHFPGKAKEKTDSVSARIAYQTFSNRIEIKRIDSLVFFHHGVESIPLQDIVLAGMPYKIFSHRLKFGENEDWILCGATSVSDFKRTARSVNSYQIAFAVLIVLLVLLAMPVLKLLIMNSIERLRLINVWFAGFAIVVGTSVLLLFILATNHSLGYRGKVDKKIIELSDSVEARFLNELSDIHDQLTMINKRHDIGYNIRTFPFVFSAGKLYVRETKSSEPVVRQDSTFLNELFTYPFFYDMMWSDKKGDQILAISSHDFNPFNKLFNLSKRYYFSNARDGKLWTLPHEPGEVRKQISLQSIRSWVDGSVAAGLSIRLPEKNGDAEVISMVTRLNSLMNPSLPPGYGFCIMDEKGEAWFHSETTKNTQENFIEEADRDDKIIAAIRGRMAILFESSYHDEKHRMYVQPINRIPLYIVVYYDLNYYKAPLILTIGFALPITLIMFFLLGVQLFLQYICVFKPTKLKIERFYLYWLRPRITENEDATKGGAMKASEKYVRAIATLAALALMSTALLFIDQTVVVSFCLLVLPLYIFPFLYLLFEQESIQKDTGYWTKENILFHPFVWLSAILIVLVNVALHDYIEDYLIAVILQIVFILIMLVGFRWKKIQRFCEKNELQHSIHQRVLHRLYTLMIFSWLLDVSILPVFSFYRTAFQQESIMWTKYIQWETANKELARQAILSTGFKSLASVDRERAKNWGNYLSKEDGFVKSANLTGYDKQRSIALHHLEFITRPQMEGIIAGTRAMLEASAADEKWSWFDHQSEPTLAMKYSDEDENDLHFFMPKLSINLWASEYFVLFIVLTAALAVLIYRVTLFAIRSIFGLGVVMDTKLIKESLREIRIDELLSEETALRKIFIVGLPYSGKGELLEQIKNSLKNPVNKPPVNDICECNVVTEWAKPFNLYNKKMVIMKNFDHGTNNHLINQQKLDWIQTALDAQVSIIISSTSQPSSIIDFYELSIQRLSARDAVEKKQEYKQAMRQWKNILSGFVTYYQPLGMAGKVVKSGDYFVKAELEHGMYLPKLEKLVANESTSTYAEQENLVLKVEELASTYYHSLWNSFSHEEKFLLYDLAKDRFVNLRNVKAIRMLLQKGIIVAGDSLQIMNKSFNNFILHVVNEDAEIRMQQELNQKGSWNLVYTVLIILVLGVIIFITLAQQNLLNDINLMLGVLGSLAAILTRFGGFLSNAPKKEQA